MGPLDDVMSVHPVYKLSLNARKYMISCLVDRYSEEEVYNSLNDWPGLPPGWQRVQNGKTKNKVKNQEKLRKLRNTIPGEWSKIYDHGRGADNRIYEIHYFQHKGGKLVEPKVKRTY